MKCYLFQSLLRDNKMTVPLGMFHIILYSQFIFSIYFLYLCSQFIFCIYFLSFYNYISHFILLFAFFSFEIELKMLHFLQPFIN